MSPEEQTEDCRASYRTSIALRSGVRICIDLPFPMTEGEWEDFTESLSDSYWSLKKKGVIRL